MIQDVTFRAGGWYISFSVIDGYLAIKKDEHKDHSYLVVSNSEFLCLLLEHAKEERPDERPIVSLGLTIPPMSIIFHETWVGMFSNEKRFSSCSYEDLFQFQEDKDAFPKIRELSQKMEKLGSDINTMMYNSKKNIVPVTFRNEPGNA
jgi:hypothetical protein